MVTNIPDRLIDLLEIAAYVYSADQFVGRGGRTMRGMGLEWRRSFRFKIPVRDIEFWSQRPIRRQIELTLGFLSDDTYAFAFERSQSPNPIQAYLDLRAPDGPPSGFVPYKVALFSGGLDSLAGSAAALVNSGDRLTLVSHHASTMIQSKQTELIEELKRRYGRGRVFHVDVRVTKGQEEARDFDQRARSFLFASLAFVIARLFGQDEIGFFENGVVSLNLPLAKHILGSRATRTTHPRVLADFGRLFSLIAEQPVRVSNPFFWLTKTEVLGLLADMGIEGLIARSFSCSHVRLSTVRGQQCGSCTQCLDRRFAVLAAGLERSDPAEGYAVDLLKGDREPGSAATLAQSYVLSARRFARMTAQAFFARHGEVFRALPHLDGLADENANRIFEVHRRHGTANSGVVDRELGRVASMDEMLGLPPSCLLSLIQGPFGSAAPIRDAVEVEPTVAEQAEAIKDPLPISRPILLAIDHKAKRAIIASSLILSGPSFPLIEALGEEYLNDLHRGLQREEFHFATHQKLQGRLGVSDPTIRKWVNRARLELREQAIQRLNMTIGDDDVIENEPWKGYRLGRSVQLVAFDPLAEDMRLPVTTSSRLSRLSPDSR